jgi:two-component system OmpR family response regulator
MGVLPAQDTDTDISVASMATLGYLQSGVAEQPGAQGGIYNVIASRKTDRILIVDDDTDFLDTLSFLLNDSGYNVSTAQDGHSLFSKQSNERPDLILLDIGLGNEDGFELVLKLRKQSNVPVIMLTGRGHETDQVVGLELGADDYIVKPYKSAELLARVKSVLRRSRIVQKQAIERQLSVAHFMGWQCDTTRRKLTSPPGKDIPLTSGEFSLLAAFIHNPDCVLSRERLLSLTNRKNTTDRSLDVQILRLRRKLGQDAAGPELIQAVRSVGYILASKVEWS